MITLPGFEPFENRNHAQIWLLIMFSLNKTIYHGRTSQGHHRHDSGSYGKDCCGYFDKTKYARLSGAPASPVISILFCFDQSGYYLRMSSSLGKCGFRFCRKMLFLCTRRAPYPSKPSLYVLVLHCCPCVLVPWRLPELHSIVLPLQPKLPPP